MGFQTNSTVDFLSQCASAAQSGDEGAWTDLVSALTPRAWSIARSFAYLTDEQREDAISDALVKLVRNISRYDSTRASIKTYFSVIVRRTCIDYTRIKDVTQDIDDIEAVPCEAHPVPDTDERAYYLSESLKEDLSEEQRLCVTLKYYEGLSYEQIGNVMGRDFHWVKNTLHAARALLRAGIGRREKRG